MKMLSVVSGLCGIMCAITFSRLLIRITSRLLIRITSGIFDTTIVHSPVPHIEFLRVRPRMTQSNYFPGDSNV